MNTIEASVDVVQRRPGPLEIGTKTSIIVAVEEREICAGTAVNSRVSIFAIRFALKNAEFRTGLSTWESSLGERNRIWKPRNRRLRG
jgi:hypothetical protein